MSTVFFLGAGASVDAGYPLASDLMKTLDKEYKNKKFNNLDTCWKNFKDFINKPRNPLIRAIFKSENPEIILTLPDILLSALSGAERNIYMTLSKKLNQATTDEEFEKIGPEFACNQTSIELSKIENAKNSFIKVIEDFFLYKHCCDSSNRSTYQYLINAFTGLKKGDTIITTNWDTLAERALLDLGYWYPTDGYNFIRKLIEQRRSHRHPVKPDITFPPSLIKVLKLHGSIGWHNTGEKVYLRFDMFLQYLQIPPDKMQLTDEDFPNIGLLDKSELILPSYLKQISSPILQNIWIEADRCLKVANKIVFIGYSLPPADIGVRVLLNPLRKRLQDGDVEISCVLGSDSTQSRVTRDNWKEFLGGNINYVFKTTKDYFNSHQ